MSLRSSSTWLWHLRASQLFLHLFQHFWATLFCGLNSSTTKSTQHCWCHRSYCANTKSGSGQTKQRRGNTMKVRIVSANKISFTLACFEQFRLCMFGRKNCWWTLDSNNRYILLWTTKCKWERVVTTKASRTRMKLDYKFYVEHEFLLQDVLLAKSYYICKRACVWALIVYYFLNMIAFCQVASVNVIIFKKE